MLIQVRNYRRARRADIELSAAAPVALLVGKNGEGKTSILEAVSACLVAEPIVVPDFFKKDAGLLVHEGENLGNAVLSLESGHVEIIWPDCRLVKDGERPPRASRVAVGLKRFNDLLPADRANMLTDALRAMPKLEDLTQAMVDGKFSQVAIDKTWENIVNHGWEAAHAKVAETATMKKGAWSKATGAGPWGDKKGAAWHPARWDESLGAMLRGDLEGDLASARADLEKALRSEGAVSGERDRLQALADRMPEIIEQLRVCGIEESRLSGACDVINAEPVPKPLERGGEEFPCPHCGGFVQVMNGRPVIPDALGPSDEEVSAQQAKVDDYRQRRNEAIRLHQDAVRKVADLVGEKGRADHAVSALAKMGSTEVADGGALSVQQHRDLVDTAQVRLAAFDLNLEAAKLHNQIVLNIRLSEILAPDGLRRTAMAKAIEAFNKEMFELGQPFGWPQVEILPSLGVKVGRFPYQLHSPGIRWRADAMLQIALAKRLGDTVVLLDGAEVLDNTRAARGALFSMLKDSGLFAVVTMNAAKPEAAPDLTRTGAGRTYFVSDGIAEPIGSAD